MVSVDGLVSEMNRAGAAHAASSRLIFDGEWESGDDDMTGVVMGKQELANWRVSCQNL